MRSPVAFGSSVPQWPTFLMPKRRRMASTTSCDVGPAGLSMRMAPSRAENSCIILQLRNSGGGFEGKIAYESRMPDFVRRKGVKSEDRHLSPRDYSGKSVQYYGLTPLTDLAV